MRTLTAVASLCLGITALGQATIVKVGLTPGTFTNATAVSGDGRYVFGYSGGSLFRWTDADGEAVMENLGLGPANTFALITAANHDGSVAVGEYSSNGDVRDRAFRWTASGGMEALAMPTDATEAFASGVSADGSVVVGRFFVGNASHAFRWTAATGMQRLSNLGDDAYGDATAVSADGLVVTGNRQLSNPGSTQRVYRWSAPGSVSFPPTTGGTSVSGQRARAISADGMTVVGRLPTCLEGYWRVGVGSTCINFPVLPLTLRDLNTTGVSGDGSTLVGWARTEVERYAIVWSGSTAQVLKEALRARGANVCHWDLREVGGISSDGNVIVGGGLYDGQSGAFVARFNGGGAGDRCGCGDFNEDRTIRHDWDIRDFFKCLSGNCCPTCGSTDFNGDGDYGTDADIEAFFRVLAGEAC